MSDPRAAKLRKGYASIAKGYRETLVDELRGKPLDRAFLDAFAERCGDGTIIEVGCGPGQVARYLAERGARVEGLDLSPEMIAEANAAHPGLSFRVGDMFALPFGDASVHGVVAFYAIVHTPTAELASAFRDWARVLVPGGLVAVAFHVGGELVRVEEMFGATTSLDFYFHEPEGVTRALVDAGFTLEARLDREPYPGAEHASKRSYLLARR